jgi:hypothetical protein
MHVMVADCAEARAVGYPEHKFQRLRVMNNRLGPIFLHRVQTTVRIRIILLLRPCDENSEK